MKHKTYDIDQILLKFFISFTILMKSFKILKMLKKKKGGGGIICNHYYPKSFVKHYIRYQERWLCVCVSVCVSVCKQNLSLTYRNLTTFSF